MSCKFCDQPLQAPLNLFTGSVWSTLWMHATIFKKKKSQNMHTIGFSISHNVNTSNLHSPPQKETHVDTLLGDFFFFLFFLMYSCLLCILSLKLKITIWPPGARFTLPKTFDHVTHSHAEAGAPIEKRKRKKKKPQRNYPTPRSQQQQGPFHPVAPLIAGWTVPDWDTSTN